MEIKAAKILKKIQEKFGKDANLDFRVEFHKGIYEVYTKGKKEPIMKGDLHEIVKLPTYELDLVALCRSEQPFFYGNVKYISVSENINDY